MEIFFNNKNKLVIPPYEMAIYNEFILIKKQRKIAVMDFLFVHQTPSDINRIICMAKNKRIII